MRRVLVASAIAIALASFVVSPASAADFGTRGNVALVVDNFAGFFHDGNKQQDRNETGYYSFGGSPQYFASLVGAPITRFGVHYFAADGVSFGTGLIWADLPFAGSDVTILGLAPRVGYFAKLDDANGFWLRGGISYLHYDISQGPASETIYNLALAAEIQYVHTFASHLGITVGPMIEWGVAGSASENDNGGVSQSVEERAHLWGLSMGFLFSL